MKTRQLQLHIAFKGAGTALIDSDDPYVEGHNALIERQLAAASVMKVLHPLQRQFGERGTRKAAGFFRVARRER